MLIDDDARDAMSWAIATDLLQGISFNEISPHTATTRAQMVTVMLRFMEYMQK